MDIVSLLIKSLVEAYLGPCQTTSMVEIFCKKGLRKGSITIVYKAPKYAHGVK